MIILVAGSDSWRVAQDVARLKAHFIEKFDSTGMNVSEGSQKEDSQDLLTAVRSAPFLSDRRMIIAKQIGIEEEEIAFAVNLAQYATDTSILVLLSSLASKELGPLESALNTLEGIEFKTHYYDSTEKLGSGDIAEAAQHYGLRLSNAQVNELTLLTKNGLNHMHTLFAALKDAVAGGVVDEITWRNFFPKKPESQAFDYVDALLSGNPLRSVALCEDIIGSGGELMPLWSMVYTQLRKSYALYMAGPEFSKAAADMGISLYEQNKIKRGFVGDGKYIKAAYEAFCFLEKQGKKAAPDMQRSLRALTDITLTS
jgi:DNA polymerase III delta subunit